MSAMRKSIKSKSTTATSVHSKKSFSEEAMPVSSRESRAKLGSVTEPCTKHKEKQPATKIIAHINCGLSNNLFLRGEGISTLSWDQGVPMKNVGPNEWVWESDRPFSTMEFKVLLNDKSYEQGNNHTIAFGQELDLTPQF